MGREGYPGEPFPLSREQPVDGDNQSPPPWVPPESGAFATVTDLETRWHSLTGAEQSKAAALLDDASDVIRTTCPAWRKASEATLKRVTCAITKRAMLARDDIAGVSQQTQTAGSFSESTSYSNPAGDLYLTASEKESLGGDGGAWAYDMATGEVNP